MKLSGFTFVHNALEGGYPIVEAINAVYPYVDEMVVVDMASTDGTRDLLDRLDVRIVGGAWQPGKAGECMAYNHALHSECTGDLIWHFEADEVFDGFLARRVLLSIRSKRTNIAVHRIQVSENFQRARWYPEPVHRVFPKGTVKKAGHTTDVHQQSAQMFTLSPDWGLLWDCSNVFRDNYRGRCKNLGILWGELPRYRTVPLHFQQGTQELSQYEVDAYLAQPHWTWKTSPFDLPDSLKRLVGKVKYEPS